MHRLLAFLLFLGLCTPALAAEGQDPCNFAPKQSAVIAAATATTTSIVAVSGLTSIFVCGFAMTVANPAASAATAALEYGTGAACTSPTALTGTYGSRDAAAAVTPAVVVMGTGTSTLFAAPSGNGICLLTVGTTFTQGVITYVQM